jgi:hypothetical protein
MDYGVLSARNSYAHNGFRNQEVLRRERQRPSTSLTKLRLNMSKSLRHAQDVEIAKRSDGSLESLVNTQALEEKEQWNTSDAQNVLTHGARLPRYVI